MQRWFLAAAAILVFMSGAQAREYYPEGYYIEYEGTPNYPDNYSDNPPIYDGISDVYWIDDVLGERGFDEIIKNSIIGVDLFYKGRKVGEVQNVNTNPFPNILFTEAMFFISEPGIAQYSYVPEYCPGVECEPVIYYTDTYVSLQHMTFSHWDHTVNPIPEPETYAMMLSGLAFLGMAGRRKRKP